MINTNETPREKAGHGLASAGRIAGALGIVLVASAPFTWFLTGEGGALLFGKLLLGVVLLALYALTNPRFWRRFFGARSTPLAAMSVLSVVVAIAAAFTANYLAVKNQKELDVTKEGLYTLSDQTRGVLGRLKDDVEIYAFYASSERPFASVQETLQRYRAAGARLSFSMIDPAARPDLVAKFKIVESGPRIVVTARDQEARAKDASEEELTNAIIKVAEQTQKTIYFLTGHSEAAIDDETTTEGYKSYADSLRAEGYTVEALSLRKAPEATLGQKVALGAAAGKDEEALALPADAAVVIIGGAVAPLLAPEVRALEDYLARGGRVFLLVEPESDAGLSDLLRQWKVELRKDIIVDTNPMNRLLGLGPAAPMVEPAAAQSDHPIVKSLTAPAVFMTARSLAFAEDGPPEVSTVTLLETGSSAWGETKLVGGTAAFDDKDHEGPLGVLMAATREVEKGEGRLVVAGDSEWLNNRYLPLQGNRDLGINVVHFLAEEQERIAIRPRSRTSSQLYLTGEQMTELKFFSLDILPVLIVAAGLGIVLLRRQR